MFSGLRSLKARSEKQERDLPVHDFLLVAVVDAEKNLLHEDCGVLLGELSTCDDFVEELTTLADSGEKLGAWLLTR